MYLKANKKLLKRGAAPSPLDGWYVVVRGSVAAGGVILPHGATMGAWEVLGVCMWGRARNHGLDLSRTQITFPDPTPNNIRLHK